MLSVWYMDSEYYLQWKGKHKTFSTQENVEEFLTDNGIYCYELLEDKVDHSVIWGDFIYTNSTRIYL